jgi:ubiquinone biosynthesis protein
LGSISEERHRCVYLAAWVFDFGFAIVAPVRPLDVIEHLRALSSELGLRLESASASEFTNNTAQDKGFALPRVRCIFGASRYDAGLGQRDVT